MYLFIHECIYAFKEVLMSVKTTQCVPVAEVHVSALLAFCCKGYHFPHWQDGVDHRSYLIIL